MTPEKEIIKESLKAILTFMEIHIVLNEKNIAVKDQDFQKAYDLRCKQVELEKQLPTQERIIELQKLL